MQIALGRDILNLTRTEQRCRLDRSYWNNCAGDNFDPNRQGERRRLLKPGVSIKVVPLPCNVRDDYEGAGTARNLAQ